MLWFEHRGVSYHKAYGHRTLVPETEEMTEDTLFDAASLTKVVACTPAIMLLIERGQVKLSDLVQSYIPEFTGGGKEKVTVRHLMVHTSPGCRQPGKNCASSDKFASPPATHSAPWPITMYVLMSHTSHVLVLVILAITSKV